MKNIMKAIDEIIVGFEKKERLMSLEEKKIVSYHEAGHCLLAYVLKACANPIKVSIIPRGDAALGFSQQEEIDKKLWKKTELIDRLCVIYGGRIAEEITFDSITTGAYDDIEKATKLAYSMVTKYGFYDQIGTINLDDSMSEQTRHLVDQKVREVISETYSRAKQILIMHKDYLEIIANHLFENEILYASDLEILLPNIANTF
jgi:cell division protease FtsH